jgi:hypothetical protein
MPPPPAPLRRTASQNLTPIVRGLELALPMLPTLGPISSPPSSSGSPALTSRWPPSRTHAPLAPLSPDGSLRGRSNSKAFGGPGVPLSERERRRAKVLNPAEPALRVPSAPG